MQVFLFRVRVAQGVLWWKVLHPGFATEEGVFISGHLTHLKQGSTREDAMACEQLLKALLLLCQIKKKKKNSTFLQLGNSREHSPSPCRDLTCVDTDKERGLLRQSTSADSCYSANCSSFSTYCCLPSCLIPGPFSLLLSPLHVLPECRK